MVPHHLAARFDALAQRLDVNLERRIHEFSLAPSPDPDAPKRSTTNDPTTATAFVRDDLRGLSDRWQRQRNTLCATATRINRKANTPAAAARLIASHVRENGVTRLAANQLMRLAIDLETTVFTATPMDRRSAEYLLGEVDKVNNRTERSCEACETPRSLCGGGRFRSGLCGLCYAAERRLERQGRYLGRAEFVTERIQAIVRNDPDVAGKYEHSPYTPRSDDLNTA